MTPIRIVIADDHPIFRAGLLGLLSDQEDFQVVGEAANGREAVQVVRHAAPDVLLVDLQMPELDGLHAIRQIRELAPGTRILVLTTYDSDGDILRAVEAGATGYLLK
ncbi:MAG TPA: response regulator transcription factor, partial [Gemmatimonadales bacterium]|nr:response regulator transcription factor [Gemmatimonadales bacterium]